MTDKGLMIPLTREHREIIQAMRSRAEEWLQKKGIDQYNGANAAKARADLDAELDAGYMVGWAVKGQIVAVAAIKGADRDFWTEEEAAQEDATWIGRFMVAESGKGYGEDLLEAMIEHERARGKKKMRLDCWKTNTALHRYYENHGFHHVRTVNAPGRMSGTLFERNI